MPFNPSPSAEFFKITSKFGFINLSLNRYKIKPFSKILMSVSVRTFLLKLNTVWSLYIYISYYIIYVYIYMLSIFINVSTILQQSSSLRWGKGMYLYGKFLWGFFICLTTFFQKYFEWRSCIIFMKEVMSLTIVTMEIVKSQFLSYHNNSCFVQKKLYQKFEFDGLELPLEKIDWLNQCRFR